MAALPGRPVRILVNAVSAHTGGGLTYAFEQLRELAALRDLELTVLATPPLAEPLQAACPDLRIVVRPRRPLPVRVAWEQLAIPVLARRHDVVYMLGNFAAFAHRGPQVVALQNPYHFGARARAFRSGLGSRRARARLALEATVARASVRRATRAIAVSHSQRATIEEDVGAPSGLRTIPSGAPRLPPSTNGNGRRRYALAVANDYPHKEWDTMLAAFASGADLPPLVVVGACSTPRRRRELEDQIAQLPPGRISLVGAVNDRSALAGLYRDALCLVAHSRLEAFPLTPYEALSAGVPVAASDIAAHREACGSRAVYYDPDVPGSMGRAVMSVVSGGKPGPTTGLTTWRENAAAVAIQLREAAAG